MTLNLVYTAQKYPLPITGDMFTLINGGGQFIILDLQDVCNQIPLDDGSCKIVVTDMHCGLFCFNRLPSGVPSEPTIFQRTTECIVQGVPWMRAHLDGMIKCNDAES